ncbi:MFS transporter [Leptotrichia sp. OH3620_COT-345]|uniref:MFS transporter n=1 Tax=Leptotrichia sp. OH3620_COT-345 TaxID=2491048 RepID=UPI000F652489|nr:MFS transporter [Leptotrichia sp. OH3620_COT-345]RRD40930.1 MFS transporter [Leptotrichia sp. OH3620_COT-345]
MLIESKENKWKNKISLFLFSQTVSTLGSSVVSFSILWYITLKYSSGTFITILVLCTFVPQIIISLFAGVWADKYSKKLIIILSDTFIALATFTVTLFFLLGNRSLYVIYAASIIRSIGSGIQAPAISAVIPEIVPEKSLMKINGINSTVYSAVSLLSPVIGGIILGSLGIVYSLMFDVVTAIIGIGIISFLKFTENTDKSSVRETGFSQLKAGLKYAKNNIVINKMLKLFILIYIIITPVAFLYPLMIKRIFGNDLWKITLSEIVWSLGMIIGGFIVSCMKNVKNKIKLFLAIYFILGIDFFFLSTTTEFNVLLIILFLGGIFIIIGDTIETTFIQENTDSEMMGRVFSMIHFIRVFVYPFSILFFGPLSDKVKIEHLICGTSILLMILPVIKFFDKSFMGMEKKSENL